MSREATVPHASAVTAATAALAALAAVALTLGALAVASRGDVTAVAILLNAAVASVPLLLALAGRRTDPFEPIVLFDAAFAVLFVLRPIVFLRRGLLDAGFLGRDVASGYDRALLVGFAGAVAFTLGYYSGLGRLLVRNRKEPRDAWPRARMRSAAWAALAISVTVFAFYVATNGGPALLASYLRGREQTLKDVTASASGYIYTAPLWTVAVGALVLGTARRWWSAAGLAGFAILAYSQITSLGTGGRSYLLPAVGSIWMLWYLRKGRRPRLRHAALVGVVVFFLGITLPRVYRDPLTNTGGIASATQTTFRTGNAWDGFILGEDTAMADGLAVEVIAVPDLVPHAKGSTYVGALARPIPRAFWAGKPRSADELLNASLFPRTARQRVGFAFSVFGEPWLNGGWAGVVLVLAVFGVAWRALWEWFRRWPRNRTVMIAYALCWPFMVVYMRGGIGVDYQRQAFVVVPLVLLARAVHGARRRATR